MPESAENEPSARLFSGLGVLVSNVVLAIMLLPLVVFVFSLLGRYFYYAELACNFRCQIMFLLMPFALLALVARRWWLCGMLMLALGWSLIGIVSDYLPGFQPPAGGQSLKVMSYNVLARNWNHPEIVSQILDADPDFVSILEYSVDWHWAMDGLNERYPYQVRVPRWHVYGIAMFSKYPISDTKVVQLMPSVTDNPFITTNVTFGDQTIRMAALHTVSPINPERLQLRNQQIAEVAEELSKSDVPTIVMGDFNCTPWSSFLVEFVAQTGYRDSRRGFGYQATWPANHWILRIPIDHAFVSPDVHVHSRVVGERSDSDHLPILVEVSTAKQ